MPREPRPAVAPSVWRLRGMPRLTARLRASDKQAVHLPRRRARDVGHPLRDGVLATPLPDDGRPGVLGGGGDACAGAPGHGPEHERAGER
jgi:hypothetical protein